MVEVKPEAFETFWEAVRAMVREEVAALLTPHVEAHRAMRAPRVPFSHAPKRTGELSGWRPSEVWALRKSFGQNRVQFGRAIGVSTWTVFMWEHGKVVPSAASGATLDRARKALTFLPERKRFLARGLKKAK